MTDTNIPPNHEILTTNPESSRAALSYVAGWLSGLILLFLERRNAKVRFHALQSVVIFGSLQLLWFIAIITNGLPIISVVIGFFLPYVFLAAFVLWLFLILSTYQGKDIVLPVIGLFVKKHLRQ